MLQQLRATMTGFPIDDEIAPGYWHIHACCSEEAKEQADAEARQRWEGILERMIFLLGEMDEDSFAWLDTNMTYKFTEINAKMNSSRFSPNTFGICGISGG